MDYDSFRHFADSWGLLYLFAICLAVLFFTFRPGARKNASDAAMIPFREDATPPKDR
ncbi:MAG TPA: cbb3-type cytochrome c oxidase subunit 3 [Devosiaceae bacterium]